MKNKVTIFICILLTIMLLPTVLRAAAADTSSGDGDDPAPFDGTIEWNPEDVQYKGSTPYVIADGTAHAPRFTVKDAEGAVVDPSTYTYEYRENVNAGTGYVILTFTGSCTGTARAWFKIYLPATTNTYVENVNDGVKVKWDPVEGAAGYVIYRRAWSSTTNGWTSFGRWNNTTGTTYIDGTDESHKVYAGTRYQYGVKAYFERRVDPISGATIGGNIGDNYNLGLVGPLKTTVRITTRELTKLVSDSKKITAYWSPSKNFTGYQVQRATDAAFKKNVNTIKISDPTKSSTVLNSLTDGTLYYVRVRSYHEFEGMTYFGCWSNVLSATPVSPTKYRALSIGQNNYPSSPLYGCVNDMNAMAGMLGGLKNTFTVTKLANATKTQIMNGITTAYKGATESDVSLFSYSGHGVNAGGSGTYQGALVDINEDLISLNELAAALSKVPGRVIVILDSCHSGSAIKGRGNADADLDTFNRAAIEAFSGYCLENGDAQAGQKMGEFKQSKFIVVTAASYNESSWDGGFDGSGYSQGAFTAALIQGMGCSYPNGAYSGGAMPADKNNDKQITLKELYDYVKATAYSWVGQTAQYYGPDSEVLFRR
ncbi:MAG: caspase family protein [Clostridia bacterium]|nr:caspase family protein [Clostridia bacterium]